MTKWSQGWTFIHLPRIGVMNTVKAVFVVSEKKDKVTVQACVLTPAQTYRLSQPLAPP